MLELDPPELDPIVSEFSSTEEADQYDRRFRAKVEAASRSARPHVPHGQVMAEMRAIIEDHSRARPDLDR